MGMRSRDLLWCITALLAASTVMGDKLIYGLDYNPRRDWYVCPTVDQVVEDLKLLMPLTDRIRLYSFTDCNQTDLVLSAVTQMGTPFKLILGMWTTNDTTLFDAEFAMMKYVFQKYPQQVSNVEMVVVGSEAILRKEQTVQIVSQNVQTVKRYLSTINAGNILVTFADIAQNFLAYPDLVRAVDVVFVNKFPFWEAQYISNAIPKLFSDLASEESKTSSKPFMISETGWPDAGSTYYNAVPNDGNAQYYFQNFICQANSLGLKYLYFAAFDDGWKQKWQMGPQGVETHWGIFNFDRTKKARIDFACNGQTVTTLPPTQAPTQTPTQAPTTGAPTTAAPTQAPTRHKYIPYTLPPDTPSVGPDYGGQIGSSGKDGKIAIITVGTTVGIASVIILSLAGYKFYQKKRRAGRQVVEDVDGSISAGNVD
jgi:glucan 1,3-beta-glucosidase